jgi:uracil-DNA glycosylase
LTEPHVSALTQFVDQVRHERGGEAVVPYCDPADGGVRADCLFLLEAPGPRAVKSGFVSRNNPDETAKNFMLLNEEARIPRARTVTWNIVPWYIGNSQRIRSATARDVEEGWPYLRRLLALLPHLAVAVLVGRNAQRIRHRLTEARPNLRILDCPHPSPLNVNRRPENRGRVLDALRAAMAALP